VAQASPAFLSFTKPWELGNALEQIIQGKNTPNEQGAKDLTDCYYGAGTSDNKNK